jgi:hypothetical protein
MFILIFRYSATTKQNKVILLQPPTGSAVGDHVFLQGATPDAEVPPRINPKQWEKIVAGLFVKQGTVSILNLQHETQAHWANELKGGLATFKDIPLVSNAGSVTVPGIADDSGIH